MSFRNVCSNGSSYYLHIVRRDEWCTNRHVARKNIWREQWIVIPIESDRAFCTLAMPMCTKQVYFRFIMQSSWLCIENNCQSIWGCLFSYELSKWEHWANPRQEREKGSDRCDHSFLRFYVFTVFYVFTFFLWQHTIKFPTRRTDIGGVATCKASEKNFTRGYENCYPSSSCRTAISNSFRSFRGGAKWL